MRGVGRLRVLHVRDNQLETLSGVEQSDFRQLAYLNLRYAYFNLRYAYLNLRYAYLNLRYAYISLRYACLSLRCIYVPVLVSGTLPLSQVRPAFVLATNLKSHKVRRWHPHFCWFQRQQY